MKGENRREHQPTALRKLSEILTLSVEDIAQDLGISKSYAHQLRSGQQALPPKLARVIVLHYGVHPDSLAEDKAELLDCDGHPYTRESFSRHQEPAPQKMASFPELGDTVNLLFSSAAEAGRLPLVMAVLRDQLLQLLDAMPDLNRSFRERVERSLGEQGCGPGQVRTKDVDLVSLLPRDWILPRPSAPAKTMSQGVEPGTLEGN